MGSKEEEEAEDEAEEAEEKEKEKEAEEYYYFLFSVFGWQVVVWGESGGRLLSCLFHDCSSFLLSRS